ncbi:nitrogen fixation protein FixH [Rhodovulum iodosum]|uniref:Nitrogen fixation protein FixH n=1 Tax=Rhodovulum iodosum TaxID=68291 RepID=A0ABV3XTJ5_9RHOB|nr:FixH family protein [Rhodovulum robiginosum]RSK32856.1 nitrogen fixation protein FixH [Rhodovulum robiginosum]
MSERKLTGRHVLIITVTAFAVVIGVNLTLAFQAVSTFPGLEVDNSYVASQKFDAARNAQEALGWQVAPRYEDGVLRITFTDMAGRAVDVARLDATVGRATNVQQDQAPDFSGYAGDFSAPVDLAPGYWNIRLEAEAPDGTLFRQRLELYVRG